MSSFYSWAVDEGLAKDNPACVALRRKDVKSLLKSDHDPKSQPYLKSWDEVMKLYKALEAPTAIAYLISARAGLRPGEVIGLRWGDVGLKAKTIRVERQVRSGKEGPTKSGKPRTVPIIGVLAKELAAWCRKSAATEATDLVCPPSNRVKLDGSLGARWGKFVGPKTIAADMAMAFAKTKIKASTFYNYGRHTFGSLSGLGGISTWRLQEILGHIDIKTTLHYVSLRGQELDGPGAGRAGRLVPRHSESDCFSCLRVRNSERTTAGIQVDTVDVLPAAALSSNVSPLTLLMSAAVKRTGRTVGEGANVAGVSPPMTADANGLAANILPSEWHGCQDGTSVCWSAPPYRNDGPLRVHEPR